MMNTNIRKLEDDIIMLLNASDVPIEAKRLVVSDILNIVTKKANDTIAFEIKTKMEEKKDGIQQS